MCFRYASLDDSGKNTAEKQITRFNNCVYIQMDSGRWKLPCRSNQSLQAEPCVVVVRDDIEKIEAE